MAAQVSSRYSKVAQAPKNFFFIFSSGVVV
jgi:hypothetical protein